MAFHTIQGEESDHTHAVGHGHAHSHAETVGHEHTRSHAGTVDHEHIHSHAGAVDHEHTDSHAGAVDHEHTDSYADTTDHERAHWLAGALDDKHSHSAFVDAMMSAFRSSSSDDHEHTTPVPDLEWRHLVPGKTQLIPDPRSDLPLAYVDLASSGSFSPPTPPPRSSRVC